MSNLILNLLSMKEENSRKLLWIIRLNTPSFLQNTTVLRPPHQPVENDDTDVFNFQLSIFNYKEGRNKINRSCAQQPPFEYLINQLKMMTQTFSIFNSQFSITKRSFPPQKFSLFNFPLKSPPPFSLFCIFVYKQIKKSL